PQYPMAVDRTCWVGEPVAMIVARTRAEAEDAAERVRIEWQELPVVAEKKTALAPGTPAIHAELGDNLAFRKTIDTGDVEAAFAKADLVIEETFEFGRHTAVSLEPRAVLEGTQVLNVPGGPYRHKPSRARATIVYLNKPPSSQYRAVGHPIGNTGGEHLVDRAAAALGIDAIEMRRRNVMPDDGYPAMT